MDGATGCGGRYPGAISGNARWQMPSSPDFDLDRMALEAQNYYTGSYLDWAMQELEAAKKVCANNNNVERQPVTYVAVSEPAPEIEVVECEKDGSACIVEMRWSGVEPVAVYNLCTRQWLGQDTCLMCHSPFEDALCRRALESVRVPISVEILPGGHHQFAVITPTPGPVVTPTLIPLETPSP